MRQINMNYHTFTGYQNFTNTLLVVNSLIVTPQQNNDSCDGTASDVLCNNICQKWCESKVDSEKF